MDHDSNQIELSTNETTTTNTTKTTDNVINTNINGDGTPKLTKSAIKRQIRQEKWEAVRDIKRKQQREKRKINAKKKRETMTEEELKTKQDLDKKKNRDPKTLDYCGTVLFDMEDSDQMNDREKKSLTTQMTFLYGTNKIADKPFHLEISGLRGDIKDKFARLKGFEHWNLMTPREDNYIDTYKDRIQDLVYLTSDSPNTITTLDSNKIYIIGALVDHNRLKKLTFNKATKQQIYHAKLPITDYIQLFSRKVLTVNHVFGILVRYTESLDWKKAFEAVIPLRKFEESKKQGPKNNNNNEEEEDDEVEEEDDQDDQNNEDNDKKEIEEEEMRKKIKIETGDGKIIAEPK